MSFRGTPEGGNPHVRTTTGAGPLRQQSEDSEVEVNRTQGAEPETATSRVIEEPEVQPARGAEPEANTSTPHNTNPAIKPEDSLNIETKNGETFLGGKKVTA
jgi:hypothetical protein